VDWWALGPESPGRLFWLLLVSPFVLVGANAGESWEHFPLVKCLRVKEITNMIGEFC